MAWEFVLRCNLCRRKYRIRTGDFRYYSVKWQSSNIPLFDRIHCSDQDGWCHRCRHPRAIESLPSLKVLEQIRASFVEQQNVKRLVEIDVQMRWRQERLSAPRCFCCGSSRVEPMNSDYQHPDCGGLFEIAKTPDHLQTSFAVVLPAEGPQVLSRLFVWWRDLIGRNY